jgi:alpha-L-fucosidase 2
MAIHPLGLITAEGGARDQRIIDGSLAQVAQLGTRNWCGYSFSWLSCMAARTGKSDLALQNLDTFVKAFISRNGFHLNGDQLGGKNSNFTYRPFTLEGNFAAAQAVHEMLLQSWNGVLRVFPAVPDAWRDVAFNRMRAEGAFEVSGIRRDGHTESVEVLANRDGQLRLRNPFGADAVEWNRADLKEDGGNLACTLRQGEKLVGKRKQ